MKRWNKSETQRNRNIQTVLKAFNRCTGRAVYTREIHQFRCVFYQSQKYLSPVAYDRLKVKPEPILLWFILGVLCSDRDHYSRAHRLASP